ncbi:MAG: hypothetical protein AAB397_00500 [Patescibacteria group bacterium]
MKNNLRDHDGELPEGVAEKFIEWAKGEKLSFWNEPKNTSSISISYTNQ